MLRPQTSFLVPCNQVRRQYAPFPCICTVQLASETTAKYTKASWITYVNAILSSILIVAKQMRATVLAEPIMYLLLVEHVRVAKRVLACDCNVFCGGKEYESASLRANRTVAVNE